MTPRILNDKFQRLATQRNATQRNATQHNATQRNATQRNATQRKSVKYFDDKGTLSNHIFLFLFF